MGICSANFIFEGITHKALRWQVIALVRFYLIEEIE